MDELSALKPEGYDLTLKLACEGHFNPLSRQATAPMRLMKRKQKHLRVSRGALQAGE